jgi:hypothetical protein
MGIFFSLWERELCTIVLQMRQTCYLSVLTDVCWGLVGTVAYVCLAAAYACGSRARCTTALHVSRALRALCDTLSIRRANSVSRHLDSVASGQPSLFPFPFLSPVSGISF